MNIRSSVLRVFGISATAFGILMLASSFSVTGLTIAEYMPYDTRALLGAVVAVIGVIVLWTDYETH